jgi:(1->4)-alpha-D-glucan 1-alpha-D-glucosylmutase
LKSTEQTLPVAGADVERHRVSPSSPRATYRLQFNHTFTFNDAKAIIPYLADLGISHLYASPIFAAAPGSMHGYDVVDYSRLNPEIGTPEEFDALVEELHAHEMRLIVDFVPNHMGIESGRNAWWQDVLEHGPWSPYADYFDIDWSPLKHELRDKVLLPFLGGQYGDVLESGEFKLAWRDEGFVVDYWNTPLPVTARSWPMILEEALGDLRAAIEPDHIDVLELESIATSCQQLDQTFVDRTAEQIELRRRESLVIRHRMATLLERSEETGKALALAIERFNGVVGKVESFDLLDRLLDLQWYRLAFWRVASEEINYRRFFAINTLAAVRQEEPAVFAASHALLLQLCAEGKVDGVRIDHPDGLWDPAGYFRQLQAEYLKVSDPSLSDEAIRAKLDLIAAEGGAWPLYIVGEKILEHGESLPDDWAIAGTVGYEFAQSVTGLFVDSTARQLFDQIFTRFTGDRIRFPELVYEMKQRMMREAFASEINVLTNLLNRISERDRHSRDFTANSLRNVLREVIAGYPVYRTYTTCTGAGVNDRDTRYNEAAIAFARKRSSVLDPTLFDFVHSVLRLQPSQETTPRVDVRCHFAMKLQQLTGPVMAKALEDTAFYRFNRLVSLNEVGGDPGRFGASVEEFHRQNRARLRTWPHGLLTSSTHDTKRSEDVRARISVLSEIPTVWRAAINRWSRLNRKLKKLNDGALAPHRADEYVIYQTLVGTWPLEGLNGNNRAEYQLRLSEYMIKVTREASRFTNWVNPDMEYEAALTGFVTALLQERRSRAFIKDFSTFVESVRNAGLANGLSQQLLKLTSPGVPDIYQGTEIWDDSLVDPDNRRQVDFGLRRELAGDDLTSGALKLHLTRSVLTARRERPAVFSEGDYVALTASGPRADHLIAFARVHEGEVAVTIASRLMQGAGEVFGNSDFWDDTVVEVPQALNGSLLHDRLADAGTISALDLTNLFARYPLAFLTTWKRGER